MLARLREACSSPLALAMWGGLLLWASLPPLGLWLLAWIAPVPWLLLVRRRDLYAPAGWADRGLYALVAGVLVGLVAAFPGKALATVVPWPVGVLLVLGALVALALLFWLCRPRPYGMLWLVGFLFWLAALHWLRLAYWATGLGGVLAALYLACYLPVFVGLSRVAVQRLRIPVILAAPVVWTGLELARAHLLSGFTMASLGHTQYRWLEIIQLSDLAGAYGVGFLVMFVAACLARMVPCDDRPRAFWPLLPLAAVLLAAFAYGRARLACQETGPAVRVALVQGSVDIELDADPEKQQRIFEHYLEQTEEAVARHPGVDLIVWPETVYGGFLYGADARPAVPRDWQFSDREFHQRLEEAIVGSREGLARLAAHFHAPMLVGVETLYFGRDRLHWYNSAAYVARASAGADAFEVAGRYDKMHLVMFGEYVPLADRFPWLQDVTPLSTSTTPGARPAAFDVRGLRLAPNICYETVMPQVIRQQVNALAQEGREPDVLVNLTNDGWFWGSSELDMHLICGVFRAVECRKPLLIAANTGFSAWIDAGGRIRAQGPRRQTGLIVAQVRADPRRSWYLYYGDWPAGICLVACGALAVAGAVGKWGRVFRALASRAIRS